MVQKSNPRSSSCNWDLVILNEQGIEKSLNTNILLDLFRNFLKVREVSIASDSLARGETESFIEIKYVLKEDLSKLSLFFNSDSRPNEFIQLILNELEAINSFLLNYGFSLASVGNSINSGASSVYTFNNFFELGFGYSSLKDLNSRFELLKRVLLPLLTVMFNSCIGNNVLFEHLSQSANSLSDKSPFLDTLTSDQQGGISESVAYLKFDSLVKLSSIDSPKFKLFPGLYLSLWLLLNDKVARNLILKLIHPISGGEFSEALKSINNSQKPFYDQDISVIRVRISKIINESLLRMAVYDESLLNFEAELATFLNHLSNGVSTSQIFKDKINSGFQLSSTHSGLYSVVSIKEQLKKSFGYH